MASVKEYRDFVLEQLSEVPNLTCRPMMSEFLLYSDGAKPMYLVEDLDNKPLLAKIILATLARLKQK